MTTPKELPCVLCNTPVYNYYDKQTGTVRRTDGDDYVAEHYTCRKQRNQQFEELMNKPFEDTYPRCDCNQDLCHQCELQLESELERI